jgi:O-acetylhomoserine/O-acetylserine sulfhydrylase-like pyridoxal-dependent enzyme
VDAAITPRTKLVYAESLSNPTLRVANIPALAQIAHRHGLHGAAVDTDGGRAEPARLRMRDRHRVSD